MTLIRFKDFITEASVSGKNLHMTHVSDMIIYGGTEGAKAAIDTLQSVAETLSGSANNSHNITVKYDGAPAVFAGIDPTDGRFFVAKKGIFNKNPVVYKSVADVKADTSGDLSEKLSIAFTELSKLGIKGIVQGDIMFTGSDLKKEKIDGTDYYTFHPNTIVYAVPVDSDIGRKIASAKIGVIFHTTYTGNSFENLKATYSVNTATFKDVPSVWFDTADLKDMSGTVTMTASETSEAHNLLMRSYAILKKVDSARLDDISADEELASTIETYNNTYVRRGEAMSDPKRHAEGLVAWLHAKFDKEKTEKKTDKGKSAVEGRREERMKFFSPENVATIALMFEFQKNLDIVKGILIRKLDALQSTKTFLKTKDGFKVTGSEGYVAIDRLSNSAVKLVDRLSFSAANFSPDVLKGFQK